MVIKRPPRVYKGRLVGHFYLEHIDDIWALLLSMSGATVTASADSMLDGPVTFTEFSDFEELSPQTFNQVTIESSRGIRVLLSRIDPHVECEEPDNEARGVIAGLEEVAKRTP